MYTPRRAWDARAIYLVLLCLVAFAATVAAQVDRATLNGTVTDASGAVIQNVKVELVSPSTGLHRETVTGSRGTYHIPGIPIGTYRITLLKDGFRLLALEDVSLEVGQARTIDARLEVGARTETVEVYTSEALNRSSAEVGGVIEPQQIRDMPLDGRNWATLMTLAPGAINSGGGEQQAIRFNGRSRDDNNYSFDGIDASGVQEQAQKADARLNISLESIAEFRVSTAVYTAESGGAGGGQIIVASKTGTNHLRGSAFEFLRNDVFDARTYFDPSPLPAFRMNQFGAQLGGAIVKDHTFFFINYEGLRQTLGDVQTGALVPSAAFRAQVVAKSPLLTPIVNAFPVGQTHIDASTDQMAPSGVDSSREDYGMIRLDHRLSDRTTMFVRYNKDSAFLNSPNGGLGSHNTIDISPSNFTVQLQKVFSPTLIDEVKFGVNRSAYVHRTVGNAPLDVSAPGFDGLSGNALDEEIGTTFSYIDNLTVIRGRHTLKFGVDIRRIRLNNSGNAITTSSLSYASLNDFIKNAADSISLNAAEGLRGLRRTFYMGYAQDEVKMTPNLTLNAGLRYEYYSVAHEVQGRSLTVSAACGGFCPLGAPFYAPNYKNFAPRIGLNWAPPALHGKTVVRTGFGMYYGANQNDDFSDPLESAVPRYSVSSATLPNLAYGFDVTQTTGALSPKAIDPNRKDLYYENWDFNIQQQLPLSFVGQVGYVGSEGHHLFTKEATNLLDPLTKTRPIPSLGQYSIKRNDGNSNFNALQASLQRTFNSGLLFQAQYMWSHAIGDASIGAGEAMSYQNALCRACDRSDTDRDVRHTLTMNSVYLLPFGRGRHFLNDGLVGKIVGGWDVSGILTARTGLPINVTVKRKASDMLDGNTSSQRPNLVPGVSIYPAGGSTIDDWLNLAAFAVPAKGIWGNAPRNLAVGPGNYEIDMALEKRITLAEHSGLTFRTEAFNLLNHPMFANPAASISSASSFGTITSILNTGATGTGTPRRLQLSLRLDF
jgi:hypothetical protein